MNKLVGTPGWTQKLETPLIFIGGLYYLVDLILQIIRGKNPFDSFITMGVALLLLVFLVWVHAYYHEKTHYWMGKIFGYRSKILIGKTTKRRLKVCVPKDTMKPYHFLIIIIAPFIVDLIICLIMYVLLPGQFSIIILFLVVCLSGAKSDLYLFIALSPLITKPSSRIRYFKQGEFIVRD